MAKRRKKVSPPRIAPPSWSHTHVMMLENFQTSSEDGKEEIRKAFRRMAQAADAYNDLT